MNTMRQKLIIGILALFAGILTVNSGSSLQAAEDWTWPTSMPDGKFSGGKGTKEDPYLISTCQDLVDLSYIINLSFFEQFTGDYFVMTRDLVFNDNVIVDGVFNEAEKDNFKRYSGSGRVMEGMPDREFSGNFDGCGHTISGMYGGRSCLFGQTNGATIKNVTIKDSYLLPYYYLFSVYYTPVYGMSFIVGFAEKTNISNCHVVNCIANVEDTSNRYFGGIIGLGKNGCTVTNCTVNETVLLSSDTVGNEFAGGLFGNISGSTINNCHSRGKIIVRGNISHKIGGFCGAFSGNAYDCTNRMNIIIDELPEKNGNYIFYIGGFAGYSYGTSIFDRCASLGDIIIGNAYSTLSFECYAYISGFGNAVGRAEYYDCVRSGKILFNGKVESPYISINGFTLGYSNLDLKAVRCICYNECNFGNELIRHDNGYVRFFNPMFGYLDKGETQNYWGNKSYYYWTQIGDQLSSSKNYGTYAYLSDLKGTYLDQLKADYSRWGTYSNADENQNGLPLPVTCGGNITGFDGLGNAESPYIITTEAELRKLQSFVKDGNPTKGYYYCLGADINMLSEPMPQIGTSDNPFEGVFDGNGHSINDLVLENSSLFYDLAGTVKNLTLSGVRLANFDYPTLYPIASRVGYSHTTGTGDEATTTTSAGFLYNCYVNGDLYIYRSPYSTIPEMYVSGICGRVQHGSKVKDCYFKGSINASSLTVDGKEVKNTIAGIESGLANTYLYASGISTIVADACEQHNCYASYSYNTTGTFKINNNKGTISLFDGIATVRNNYFVSENVPAVDNSGITKLSSDSELTADKMNNEETSDPQWLQGMYRPVVKGSKYYTVTKPEGGTTYLDIVPESNPTANYIVNVTANDDVYSDKHIWQLPNVAVYVPSENRDYIVDGRLDQSADFSYTANANATTTVGQLYYNLAQTSNGYHMICLPGVVDKDDLPEGSQVMICGQVTKDVEGKETINVILADSIPAGVPCILYVPTTKVANGENIKFVMRSGIVSSTRLVDTNSSLTGTFKKTTVSDYCNTASTDEGTGEVKFTRSTTSTEMQPFTAWITGSEGDVTVVDYLLLDEDNNYITKTLKDYNYTEENKITTNIKLHRTIKSGQWNTVCLPFAMTKEEVESTFGAGTTVEEFESCEYNSATSSYTLKFKTSEDGGIKAGTACLLKPGVATTETIFSIKDRQISCTGDVPAGTIVQTSDGNYQINCQGSYNKQTIGEDKYTSEEIYIINGNKVYRVNSNVLMRGFRCYFICSGGTSSSAPVFGNASIEHDDGTTTSLELIETDSMNDDKIYDIVGRRQAALQKGIMIIGGKKKVVR